MELVEERYELLLQQCGRTDDLTNAEILKKEKNEAEIFVRGSTQTLEANKVTQERLVEELRAESALVKSLTGDLLSLEEEHSALVKKTEEDSRELVV